MVKSTETKGDSDRTAITDMPTLFVPSVMLTVFCLSPFGLAAMKSSRNTAGFLASGNRVDALKAIAQTRRLLRIGFVIAIVCVAMIMGLQILLTL